MPIHRRPAPLLLLAGLLALQPIARTAPDRTADGVTPGPAAEATPYGAPEANPEAGGGPFDLYRAGEEDPLARVDREIDRLLQLGRIQESNGEYRAAARTLDEALARVHSRHVQGAPLFDLQMVQGHIADMALDVDASALLIYRAAWAKDRGAPRITREAAMAKLFATDHAQQVIDKAVQLFGGDGVRHGMKVEELYRDIRALRIYEGASDVQRVVIARQAAADHLGG